MNPKIRAVLAVLAGIVVGGLAIAGLEFLNPMGVPEGTQMDTPEQASEFILAQPPSAFAGLLAIYFLASVLAGFVTNWVSKPTKYRPALVAGFGLLAAGLANLVAINHPLWFGIASSLLYLVGAWVGGRFVKKMAAL